MSCESLSQVTYTGASGRRCVIRAGRAARTATLWVALMLSASFAPMFVSPASASTAIVLSVDVVHVQLSPGDSMNVTLTIDNNGSSIEDYDITVDDAGLSQSWTVLASEELVEDVLPTFSEDTTIIVRLGIGAAIADSGSVVIYVNESDGSESSSITVHLTVSPTYGASIDSSEVGDAGLLSMAPGSSLDVDIEITNEGNVIDSIILDVDQEPDLVAWWQNWNQAQLPQPSGNESLTIVSPTNGSKHNTSSGNLSIAVDIVNLTPGIAYGFDLTASYPDNGTVVWSDSKIVNESNTSLTVNESWNASALGNISLSANLTWNSSVIAAMDILVCIHNGDDCITTPSNGTGNGTGNGSGNGSGNGTSMGRSSARTLPSGWQVRWLDDQLIDMDPGETRNRTLRITVPGGIAPTYQGLSLKAASTQGNLTWSTTLVINVTQIFNGTYTDETDPSDEWLPGETGNLSVSFTNLGTHDAEYIHAVQSSTGDCTFQVNDPVGSVLATGSDETVLVQVGIPSSSHLNDTCSVVLRATETSDASAIHTGTINLSVGVQHALRLDSPSDILTIAPGYSEQVIWVVSNDGTEQEEIYFESQSALGVEVSLPETWVVVDSGDSEQITVTISVNEFETVGSSSFSVTAKSRFSQATATAGGSLEVLPRYGFSISGPADYRVQLFPGSNSTFIIDVYSNATVPQNLSLGSSGLDSHLTLSLADPTTELILPPLSNLQFEVTLDADEGATLGDHPFDVIINSENAPSQNLSLVAQVLTTSGVSLAGSSAWIVVGPRADVNTSIHVTNLGNSEDTFLVEINSSAAGESLGLTLSGNSLTLAPGESGSLSLTLTRYSDAPGDSVAVVISVSSINSPSLTEFWNLTVMEQEVSSSVIFLNTPTEVEPEETFSGSFVVTNTGNAADSFLVSISGMNCEVNSTLELAAGDSSAPIPFTCTAPEKSISSTLNIDVHVHSLVDPGEESVYRHSVDITSGFVAGTEVIGFTVSEYDLSMKYDSATSTLVTIENNINHVIEVTMSIEGKDVGIVYASWSRAADGAPGKTASLAPGEQASFTLLLDSMSNDDSTAVITIVATSTFDGMQIIDKSEPLNVSIIAPEKAPSGLTLPFEYELDNEKGLTILAGGWILSTLLIISMILRFKSRRGREASPLPAALPGLAELPPPALPDIADEPEVALQVPVLPMSPTGLGAGEVRMNEERKVECPSCDTKLGLPRGSEPPFRFTCPKCDSSIRVVS